MRWEIRLALALGFLVASILVIAWCRTRIHHFAEGTTSHTLYLIATGIACLSLFAAAIHTVVLCLEKRS